MLATPFSTAAIILTIALGVGANSAVYAVTNALMFRALPVDNPAQIVLLHWSARRVPRFTLYANYGDTKRIYLRSARNPGGESFSYPFLEKVEDSKIFSGVAAFAGGGSLTLHGDGLTTIVKTRAVNGAFFRTLGVKPAIGRLLTSNDDKPSSSPALVLSYSCWRRLFGGQPSVLGKTVDLNGIAFTIVGVAQRNFTSMSLGHAYDLWLPLAMEPELDPSFHRRLDDPAALWILIAARLKSGSSAAQDQAEINALYRDSVLYSSKPILDADDNPRLTLIPAQKALIGNSSQFAEPLRALFIVVGVVLLIACANIAGLLLTRATARTPEITIRLALGAPRSRLLRQMLTESLALAATGGVLGCAFAMWGAHLLLAMLGGDQMRYLGASALIDWRMVFVTGALTLFTGALFGMAPTLQSLRVHLTPGLKKNSRTASSGSPRRQWYAPTNLLVIAQSALAIVVMMGAGVLVHSVTNLADLNPGFDSHHVLTFGLDPENSGYTGPAIDNLYSQLQQQIKTIPGVISVSYSQSPLLSGNWDRLRVNNLPPGSDSKIAVQLNVMPVGPDFFKTLKIPIFAGRPIDLSDIQNEERYASSRPVYLSSAKATPSASYGATPVVVNKTFVHDYFPHSIVIGQHFGMNNGGNPNLPVQSPGYIIVGVSQDAKYDTLRGEILPTIYTPLEGQNASFEVRTLGNRKEVISDIRDLLNRDSASLPIVNILTETQEINRQLQQERSIEILSILFSALAMFLSCMGIYSLLSYETVHKKREIGVRMALGARKSNIFLIVVSRGLVLSSTGTALGVIAAICVNHLLRSFLFEVRPADPLSLIIVVILVLVITSTATFIPAQIAMSVDPASILRTE